MERERKTFNLPASLPPRVKLLSRLERGIIARARAGACRVSGVYSARVNLSRTIKLREAHKDAPGTRSRVTLRSIGRIKGSPSSSSNSSADRVPFALEEGAKSGKKRKNGRCVAEMRRVARSASVLRRAFSSFFFFLECNVVEERRIRRRMGRF